MAAMILRPIAPGDEAELLRIHRTPEVARWWEEPDDGFPWSDDPESTRFVIEVDGAVGGMIQYGEELTPKYRHASIDIFLDPALHDRGLGTEAVRQLARHLIEERGHHRLTIDPAAENLAAIRAYEKAGFTRVGVMHSYERDADGRGWHDGLLMELIACVRAAWPARAASPCRPAAAGRRGRSGRNPSAAAPRPAQTSCRSRPGSRAGSAGPA
jgi:aminoglycoside 6'-N-acetyltransferase